MPTKFVIFATVLCFIGMTVSAAVASFNQNRGEAGSKNRKAWCQEQQEACEDAGKQKCTESNSDAEFSSCRAAAAANCKASWGSTSTCLTDPLRVQRQERSAINPNLPNQNAPVAPKPLPPYQQNLPLAPGGLPRQNAPVAPTPLSPQQRLQQQPMFQQTAPAIQFRGVEGAPASPAPTEEKATTPAPK